jgi:type IV pilus assembly protein PilZ
MRAISQPALTPRRYTFPTMSEFQTTALPSAFAPSGPGRIGAALGTPGVAGVASAAARPSVIQLVFREKGALYAAYIPAFTEGGLFVPTTREYTLGDDIYLLLSLPEDNQRYPVAGKIAWITPANASGGRTQGVGVRFPGDDKTRLLRVKIEQILGTNISSSKPTQTL